MSLYKIMIVDDEAEIREGIAHKIDWKAVGFEIVADAENGRDALEKAEALDLDVVLTDIKMPFMDGLELGAELSRRKPNLKLIVFSQELVEAINCADLFEEIAKTELLFTAAHVVVSDCRAQDFLEALEPTVGTRLSTDIDASIEHYVNYGITPDSRLATLFYQTDSVYSDPMAIYAMLAQEGAPGGGEEDAKEASALSGPAEQVSAELDSDIKTRYLGAAVFSDGSFCSLLDGSETVLANLLSGSLNAFWYTLEDECIKLNIVGSPKIRVNTGADPVKIDISIDLSVSNQDHSMDAGVLRESLCSDIEALIARTQDMGAEPFGFAEIAARRFATLAQWQSYDWKRRYLDADVEIKLEFEQLNA